MNAGKIMIGFSLLLLAVAMMVSPSSAAGTGTWQISCDDTAACEDSPEHRLPASGYSDTVMLLSPYRCHIPV